MNFTAKDVSDLRAATGIGMMECKKALTEANGDKEEAIKILREKGLAVAAKKADRIAAEGKVAIKVCDACGKAAMIEVNCETDFAAKGEKFVAFIEKLLEIIENPCEYLSVRLFYFVWDSLHWLSSHTVFIFNWMFGNLK